MVIKVPGLQQTVYTVVHVPLSRMKEHITHLVLTNRIADEQVKATDCIPLVDIPGLNMLNVFNQMLIAILVFRSNLTRFNSFYIRVMVLFSHNCSKLTFL